jgi:hypothetical protein
MAVEGTLNHGEKQEESYLNRGETERNDTRSIGAF